MTEWIPIPSLPGYEVNAEGAVRSLKGKQPRVLSDRRMSAGYLAFNAYVNGQCKERTVHSVVAEVFLGPRPTRRLIRHLDGDRFNNRPDNLAYGTVAENNQDTVRHGKHPQSSKTHCVNGHEFTPENTYRYGRHRACRACNAAVVARRRPLAVPR